MHTPATLDISHYVMIVPNETTTEVSLAASAALSAPIIPSVETLNQQYQQRSRWEPHTGTETPTTSINTLISAALPAVETASPAATNVVSSKQ